MIDPKTLKIPADTHNQLNRFKITIAGKIGYVPEFSPLILALIHVGSQHIDEIASVIQTEG